MSQITTYKGYRIYITPERNYWSDAFGASDVACNLATLKRWIDRAIAAKEISGKYAS